MRVDIHLVGISDDGQSISQRFTEIVQSRLYRFKHRLKHVRIYIEDVNGPKGGVDKECRCILHLRRARPIVIRDRDACLTTLAYRVANRAKSTMTKRFSKKAHRAMQDRVASHDSIAFDA